MLANSNGDNFRVCTGECRCDGEPKPYGPITRKESRERERVERFHNLYNYVMFTDKPTYGKMPNELRKTHHHKERINNNNNNNYNNSNNNNNNNNNNTNKNNNNNGKEFIIKSLRVMRESPYQRHQLVYVREPSLGMRAGSRLFLIKEKTARRPRAYIKPPMLMDMPIREHLRRRDELMRLSKQPGYKLRCLLYRGTAAVKNLLTAANVNIEMVLIKYFMVELVAWASGQGL